MLLCVEQHGTCVVEQGEQIGFVVAGRGGLMTVAVLMGKVGFS